MRTLLTFLLSSLISIGQTQPTTVSVTSPAGGSTVSGLVRIAGTTTGLGPNGGVSVSVDGGPFNLIARGDFTSWTHAWDSTAVSDGSHQLTFRARRCIGCQPATTMVTLVVANSAPPALSVGFLQPAPGATVLETMTVLGWSRGATAVTLRVDGGVAHPTNGLDPWDAIFEPGSLTPGPHTLTAIATDGTQVVSASLAIEVGSPPPGAQSFTYASSVDGEAMTSLLWVPQNYSASNGPAPLFIFLHGGGGTGTTLINNPAIIRELDARGWIGIAPDGRNWGLAQMGCSWRTSAAYVNNPDPNVGPGEQDIFDAIEWAKANFPIDEQRIYLSGFSMGGRGAYIIGLRNPDRFAAIAPLGPAIDMYEVEVRRPNPAACKQGMVGGPPGTSPFVDTMYKITSARFLIENAFNLPVFHGHGLNDTVANNNAGHAPFLHGWHITADASWSGCHGTSSYCFGHTPTLEELRMRHPDGYDWAYRFSPVEHRVDGDWMVPFPVGVAGAIGTEDPLQPGTLVGMFDFLAARSLVHSPDTVLFKTYTDEHERAYWATIESSVPWSDTPAALRATRSIANNHLQIEAVRADRLTIDLDRAGLAFDSSTPLTLSLDQLDDSALDPALAPNGSAWTTTIAISGDFSGLRALTVVQDGVLLPSNAVALHSDRIVIGPLTLSGPSDLGLFACAGWFASYGTGLEGSAAIAPELALDGCLAAGETVTLSIRSALGGSGAVLGLGSERSNLPLPAGGHLLIGPASGLSLIDLTLGGTGPGNGSAALPFTIPPSLTGATITAQALVFDAGGSAPYALTRGLELHLE